MSAPIITAPIITSALIPSIKKPASESHSNVVSNEISKERYISPQERQNIIDELI